MCGVIAFGILMFVYRERLPLQRHHPSMSWLFSQWCSDWCDDDDDGCHVNYCQYDDHPCCGILSEWEVLPVFVDLFFLFFTAQNTKYNNKKIIQNKIVIENPLYLLIYSGSFLLPNLSAISLSPLRELTEISSSFWSNVSNVPGIPLLRCS